MPRPKSYDRATAVLEARDAFWRTGYDGTSVRDIEREAGINRYALNTEFGGKEALFLEALDAYHDESDQYIGAPLRAGGLDAIEEVVRGLAAPSPTGNRRHGCLMVNTVVEEAGTWSPAVRQRIEHHFEHMARSIRSALERARRNGEIDDHVDLGRAQALLEGAVIAANVINRRAGDATASSAYVDAILAVIGTWKP